MSYVTDINGKQFKKQKKINFIWSFWIRLVVRSLFLNGPFGQCWQLEASNKIDWNWKFPLERIGILED